MKTLLEYLTKLIVKNPAQVGVVEEPTPEWTVLHLTVAPSDMGLVIGKGGKIISALRNLVRVKAIKEGKRVHLQLVENPAPPNP
jgi:predicted RNA-binding protein YlqC (UPF0109 family)